MKWIVFLLAAAAALAGLVAAIEPAARPAKEQAFEIDQGKLPPGYRQWTLISVARVGGQLNDLRAKLGNDVAMKAYREDTRPFPDGTIIARLAWRQVNSPDIVNNKAMLAAVEKAGLTPDQATRQLSEFYIAGPATNVQFMVKDSGKYASTGGWGFYQFTNGKRDDAAVTRNCFSCHAPGKDHDFVFTHYTP